MDRVCAVASDALKFVGAHKLLGFRQLCQWEPYDDNVLTILENYAVLRRSLQGSSQQLGYLDPYDSHDRTFGTCTVSHYHISHISVDGSSDWYLAHYFFT